MDAEWQKVMSPRWHAVRQGGWRVAKCLITGVIGAILGVVATLIMA